jgi:hypothetical protein
MFRHQPSGPYYLGGHSFHHLVLVVRTREDDLVLDNLNGTVRPVSQMGYRFVRAQQEENPKFWSATRLARADGFSMDAR